MGDYGDIRLDVGNLCGEPCQGSGNIIKLYLQLQVAASSNKTTLDNNRHRLNVEVAT